MALAISGFSRVRRSSRRIRSNQLPDAVGEQPLQRDEVEHLPVALAREHQPLRLVARGLGRRRSRR